MKKVYISAILLVIGSVLFASGVDILANFEMPLRISLTIVGLAFMGFGAYWLFATYKKLQKS